MYMKKPLLSIIITTHGNDYDLRNYYNIEDYSLFKHFFSSATSGLSKLFLHEVFQ